MDDEPESHRGTLRIREDDQVASPSAFADETPLKRPKLEVDEVPESQTGQVSSLIFQIYGVVSFEITNRYYRIARHFQALDFLIDPR